MKLFSLYITNEQHEKLIKTSKESGVPMAELIRMAMDDYFKPPFVKQKGKNSGLLG